MTFSSLIPISANVAAPSTLGKYVGLISFTMLPAIAALLDDCATVRVQIMHADPEIGQLF